LNFKNINYKEIFIKKKEAHSFHYTKAKLLCNLIIALRTL